jgi:uncharacterized protein
MSHRRVRVFHETLEFQSVKSLDTFWILYAPMSQHLIPAFTIPPQAWLNGGGQTRELFTWPSDSKVWQLRISMADISAPGPFSAYLGVKRLFTVLSGDGVTLHLPAGDVGLRVGDAPFAFDGAHAPGCTPIGGATTDLNVMSRDGQIAMKMIAYNNAAVAVSRHFGMFTKVSGTLTDDKTQCIRIPAMTLFWDDEVLPGSQWHFEPDQAEPDPTGWWIGFTPATV